LDWINGKLRVERGIVEQKEDGVKTDESRRSLDVADEFLDRVKAEHGVSSGQ
jgi:hypothetical protein